MNDLDPEWKVELAASKPHGDGILDTLVLGREKVSEYGDELVQSLRINGQVLRRWVSEEAERKRVS